MELNPYCIFLGGFVANSKSLRSAHKIKVLAGNVNKKVVGKEQTARVGGKINNANFPPCQIRKQGKIALFLTSTSSEGKFNPSAENAQKWRAGGRTIPDLTSSKKQRRIRFLRVVKARLTLSTFNHFLNLDEVEK